MVIKKNLKSTRGTHFYHKCEVQFVTSSPWGNHVILIVDGSRFRIGEDSGNVKHWMCDLIPIVKQYANSFKPVRNMCNITSVIKVVRPTSNDTVTNYMESKKNELRYIQVEPISGTMVNSHTWF